MTSKSQWRFGNILQGSWILALTDKQKLGLFVTISISTNKSSYSVLWMPETRSSFFSWKCMSKRAWVSNGGLSCVLKTCSEQCLPSLILFNSARNSSAAPTAALTASPWMFTFLMPYHSQSSETSLLMHHIASLWQPPLLAPPSQPHVRL